MSTRKRKETEKVPKPTYSGSSFSIDPALRGRFRGVRRDPLDVEFEAEDTLAAQDLRSMRVEEMVLKRRARMTKLQKEIDKLEKEEGIDSSSSDIPRISVAMAQQIANLDPEERDKVIETYALFSSMARGKGDSMLPLLIGFSKSNPGTPQINMLDYAKAMGDQLKTGIDLAKAFTEKEKPSNALDFMKVMKDLVIEGVRNPILTAMERNQPQPSAFEQILLNPEMRSAAKEMGMFGGGESRTGSTETDLKIEQLRRESALEIKKLDLDWRKALLETEAKDRRSDNIMAALAPLSALLATPVAARMQQLGEQQGTAHMPPNVTPPTGSTILLRCSCGHEGPMTFPGTPPSLIPCPSCGLELLIGGTPPGDTR